MQLAEPFHITVNDLGDKYLAQVENADGTRLDITSAAIVCTMKAINVGSGAPKIDRQDTGITITDAENGEFEYAWEEGDTDTPGTYKIEFEIAPNVGGKFTIPNPRYGQAIVVIHDSQDAE